MWNSELNDISIRAMWMSNWGLERGGDGEKNVYEEGLQERRDRERAKKNLRRRVYKRKMEIEIERERPNMAKKRVHKIEIDRDRERKDDECWKTYEKKWLDKLFTIPILVRHNTRSRLALWQITMRFIQRFQRNDKFDQFVRSNCVEKEGIEWNGVLCVALVFLI